MAFLLSFESCGPRFLCFFFFLSLPFFLRFFPLRWLSLSLDDEELLSLSLEEAKEEADKPPGSSSSRGACKLIQVVIAAVPPLETALWATTKRSGVTTAVNWVHGGAIGSPAVHSYLFYHDFY